MHFTKELRARLDSAESERDPESRLDAYHDAYAWANAEEPLDLTPDEKQIVKNLRQAHLRRIFNISTGEYIKNRDLVFNFLLLLSAVKDEEIAEERMRNPKCATVLAELDDGLTQHVIDGIIASNRSR